MTRQEAIDAAPGSRSGYWSSFAMAGVGSVLLIAGAVFVARKSVPLAADTVAMALVLMAMAAQSTERLFRPERAAVRTASLSATQRLWIERARTGLIGCSAAIFAVSIVMFCLPGEQRLSNELRVLMWTPFMLTHLCADLLGERIGAAGLRKRSGTNILHAELRPLQSEHWGERG
jgi:hypothetical protein